MRNLKKLLALVLAMVMAFSLMLSASAVDYKDYPDTDSITAEFDEAVRVLTGLKVFQGDEKGFRPADTITRAEAAAIIYRIATQDVAGTQEKLYSDYGTFSDVNKDDWFAGYVGYCQNAGYIKGTSPTTFSPYLKVTGYEMLAMLLRVVGYGKTNEFTGPQWQVNVASLSKELGVINNVKSANFEHTLTMAARRDVVADLAFQTMVLVPTVTYTPALSYNDKISVTATEFNPTLGQKNFGLWRHTPDSAVVDMWGRPGYYWVKDGVKTGVNTQTNKPIYGASFSSSKVVATITETPKLTYTTAVKECDLSHDYGITTTRDFTLYVNDKTPITDSYHVVATDTVTNVGGQGRLTEVYAPSDDHDDHRVVMIDTYLAKVTKVTPATLDAAGHVIVPAKLDMVVYDGINSTNGQFAAQGSTAANKGTAKTISKKNSDASNWEYSVGDMLLLNAYTLKQFPAAPSNGNKDHSSLTFSGADLDEAQNKAAFEDNAMLATLKANGVKTNWADYTNHNLTVDTNVQIVGKSEPTIAKQTVVYYNQNKHNVGGTDTPDAMLLYKDEAGTNTTSDWAWYKDQYGNIIGVDTLPNTVQYGVITSLWSSFGQGDSDTDGTAKVYAKVTLADGEETTMVIGNFLVGAQGAKLLGGHKLATFPSSALDTTEIINLVPIYDYNQTSASVMRASERTVTSGSGTYGYLHVAPVASINSANDSNNWNNPRDNTYGVIGDNMFKFVTNANGTVTAIEVAGNGTNNNMANFAGHNNALVSTTYSATQNVLYKNLGYVTLDDNHTNNVVWVDNDTQIMVRNPSTGTIACYNGVSALPGDLVLKNSETDKEQEVDWAETDGDGRAEYLYVTGTFQNDLAYGLFYYNGGGAQWNGTNGTMSGYLNGEATTLTFGNQNMFNRILTSLRDGYNGRLFAVQLSGTSVINLMGLNDGSHTPVEELLWESGRLTGTIVTTVETAPVNGAYPGNVAFVAGVAGNNSYTANTQAVWYNDLNTDANGVATGCDVRYDRITRTIKVYDSSNTVASGTPRATYTITGATKIVGNLDYLDPNASVQWLNDVTIVFEPSNINAVVEIYVTTQPTVTPPGTSAYLGDVALSNLGHTVGGWSVDAITSIAGGLTQGGAGNYSSVKFEVKNLNGATVYTNTYSDNSCDLGSNASKTLSFTYSNIPTETTYDVTLTYYNANGDVVAQGSARLTRS